ncbi:MAG: Abi family protein [Aminipila sp.]
MSKLKLTVEEQIEYMKSKGIGFNITTEETAKIYLEKNTYYFKIKSYAKNYDKYQSGQNIGNYLNLEFAYLQELATLDMHLRYFIIKMALDIEHAIKVKLLCDFNKIEEDGYSIVQKYFECYEGIKDGISIKKSNPYSSDLISKLEKEDYAIWNLIELLSFGDFIKFYKIFYNENSKHFTGEIFTYPLLSIKSLRNAAAHNNCLLNNLKRQKHDNLNTNRKIDSFISNIGIKRDVRINHMQKQVVHDFVTLLYVFNKIIESEGVKNATYHQLNELINVRMIKKSNFFAQNDSIRSTYNFIKIIVDYLVKSGI